MLRGASRIVCVLALLLSVSCVEPEVLTTTCSDGRSRCVTQVALGGRFGCATLRDRTVWCWGRNDESQLGYPTTDLCTEELPDGMTRSVACHAYPFQVVGLDHATRVTAGAAFACAMRDDGTLRCWGSNTAGQLGNGLTLPSQSPVEVRGLVAVTSVAAGARHACAVALRRVFCWGANDRGQLGLAATSRTCTTAQGVVPCEPEPTQIQGLEEIVSVTAGDTHTCALTSEGLALCWGDGTYGQLGVGEASDTPTPMPQAVLSGQLPLDAVREISAGPQHTCARTDDGAVWCWGRNDRGELGIGIPPLVPEHCVGPCATGPERVPGLDRRPGADAGYDAGFDAASDGGFDGGTDANDASDAAVEASTEDADASDAAGEVGDARDAGDSGRRVDIPLVRDALAPPSMVPRAIAVGGTFACAVLDDSTVRCWGDDADGQLGDGQRVRDPQGPVMVIATPGAASTNPLQRVASVAAGASSACALISDGSLRCWGSNQSGALGNGNTSTQSGPVPVTW